MCNLVVGYPCKTAEVNSKHFTIEAYKNAKLYMKKSRGII